MVTRMTAETRWSFTSTELQRNRNHLHVATPSCVAFLLEKNKVSFPLRGIQWSLTQQNWEKQQKNPTIFSHLGRASSFSSVLLHLLLRRLLLPPSLPAPLPTPPPPSVQFQASDRFWGRDRESCRSRRAWMGLEVRLHAGQSAPLTSKWG